MQPSMDGNEISEWFIVQILEIMDELGHGTKVDRAAIRLAI